MNDFTFENCSNKQIQIFEDLKEYLLMVLLREILKKNNFKRDDTKSVYI